MKDDINGPGGIEGLDVRTTATLTPGVKTQRVAKVRAKRKATSAGTAMRRFRKDPTTRGLDYAMVCISIPVGELAALDEVAERAQMARSHFIRQAVKHFAEKVKP